MDQGDQNANQDQALQLFCISFKHYYKVGLGNGVGKLHFVLVCVERKISEKSTEEKKRE